MNDVKLCKLLFFVICFSNCFKRNTTKLFEGNFLKIMQGTKHPEAGPLQQCTLLSLPTQNFFKKKIIR